MHTFIMNKLKKVIILSFLV